MEELCKGLNRTKTHFVYCAVPGDIPPATFPGEPILFNDEDVYEQMEQSSLLASLHAQSCLHTASRLQEVHDCWQAANLSRFKDSRLAAMGIISALGFAEAQLGLGVSEAVLFDVHGRYFEALQQIRMSAAATFVQRLWRRYLMGEQEPDLLGSLLVDNAIMLGAISRIQRWWRGIAVKIAMRDGDEAAKEKALAYMFGAGNIEPRSEEEAAAEASDANGAEQSATQDEAAAIAAAEAEAASEEAEYAEELQEADNLSKVEAAYAKAEKMRPPTLCAGEKMPLPPLPGAGSSATPNALPQEQVAVLDLAVGLAEKNQLAMKIERKYYRKYALGAGGEELPADAYSDDSDGADSELSDTSGPSEASDDMMDAGTQQRYEEYLSPVGVRRAAMRR